MNRANWLQHIAAGYAKDLIGTQARQWLSDEAILEALSASYFLDEDFKTELKRRVAYLPTPHGQAQNTVTFADFMDAEKGVLPLIRARLQAEEHAGAQAAAMAAAARENEEEALAQALSLATAQLQADAARRRAAQEAEELDLALAASLSAQAALHARAREEDARFEDDLSVAQALSVSLHDASPAPLPAPCVMARIAAIEVNASTTAAHPSLALPDMMQSFAPALKAGAAPRLPRAYAAGAVHVGHC